MRVRGWATTPGVVARHTSSMGVSPRASGGRRTKPPSWTEAGGEPRRAPESAQALDGLELREVAVLGGGDGGGHRASLPPHRLAGGDLFPDPVIALPLELEGQLLAAGLHDAAVEEHVDVVRLDVLQEPLVVRHQDHGVVGTPQAVHALRDGLERVDVEARVRLGPDGELPLQPGPLEDLVPLLLAAGEALVDRSIDEAPIHLDDSELLVQELQELHGVELLL